MSIRAAWLAESFAAHRRFVESLPPPLDRRFARVAQRIACSHGGSSFETAVTAPTATPFLALLEACRLDLGISASDVRLSAIGEATLALYICVRIQDDLVDEPDIFDRGYVFVAEAFAGRSLAAFAEALGTDAGFFAFHGRTMGAFALAAAWEIDVLHRGFASPAEERRIGEKLLPMAIPLGALAFVAGRPGQAEPLRDFVVALGGDLQVVNDLLNLEDDHVGGRPSPLLARLYREGRAAPGCSSLTLRTALLAGEVMDEGLAWAREELDRAGKIAAALELRHVCEVVQGRKAFLQRMPEILVAECLRLGSSVLSSTEDSREPIG